MIAAKEMSVPGSSLSEIARSDIARLFWSVCSGGTSASIPCFIGVDVSDFQTLPLVYVDILQEDVSSSFYSDSLQESWRVQSVKPRNRRAIELLTKWLAEHPVVDLDPDWDRLKQRLNDNRLSDRRRF